ncbi:hypothetical protein FNF31_02880 [Cafeteria roenbergensis]|uniref:USP domain-containing protein n=2 Tax=Cafeteria roenbergensis TaxID=33653 RepID=A0A5A8DDL4_CAFRO|nr:hypothetical protein FNF31_02880 [Cafeteria roenbergensis]
MIPGLREALASRKAFVDETSESSEGVGAGATGTVGARRGSKFANVSFVEKSATGYTGLVNQGATCYLNSFLQMLFMTPDFRRSLFEWKFDEAEHGDARRCLAYQLQRLFAQLQLTTRGAVRTSDLTLSFGWTGSQAFVQHDVQECMTHVMDHLSMTAVGSSLGHHVMEEQQGRMRRYVLCHGCGHLSASAEVFGSVQVPIKGFANLQAALQGLVAPEVLDGTSKYNCSGCESEQAASLGRYFDGAALPLVLTLQLVRFDFDLATMQRRKLSDELPFPAELDMATLLQPPADAVARAAEAGSGEAFEAAAEAAAAAGAGEGTVYDLFAVMLHTGGAHGGHYSAFLKELRPAEEARGARWLKFNDSSVSEMSASDIRRAFGGTREAPWDPAATAALARERQEDEAAAPDAGSAPAGAESGAKAGSSQGAAGAAGACASSASAGAAASGGDAASQAVPAATRHAYMLVYRRRSAARPPPLVADTCVPASLQAEVEADNDEFRALRKEWLWEREIVRTSVYLPTSEKTVSAAEALAARAPTAGETSAKRRSAPIAFHSSVTAEDATVLAAAALGLIDPSLAPDAGVSPPGATRETGPPATRPPASQRAEPFRFSSREECLQLCRLRRFDALRGVMEAPLGGAASEPLSAQPDPPQSHRPLALEVRASTDTEWAAWSAEALQVMLLQFESDGEGERFAPAVQLTVPSDSLAALRRAAEAATGLHGACRLVRMRGDKAEVLASDSGEEDVSLRLSLKLQPGDSVFVDPTTEGPSPVVRLLESIANEVTISFEPLRPLTELEARGVAADCPGVSEADLRGEELDTTACSVQVDQRQTLGELRRAVEGATRATPGTVRVMRPGGFEMKDATKPLAFHGLLGGGKVRLERGRPLTPAEFTLKVVVFRSADEGSPGARPSGPPSAASGAGSEASRFTELGFVTADRETPVPQLKELIAARLSSAAVPIDPTRMRLRERTGRSLAGALLDCRTLAAALSSRIVDGREVVVQTLDHGEALEEGDLLINLRVWHPQEAVLDPAGPEIAVRASTTTEQLRALAAAKLGVPPAAVVMSKVSAFMLRDKAAIANLEAFKLRAGASAEAAGAQAGADALADRPVLYGRRQPADDACIASDPWRLRSGSTVVVKDGRAVETLQDHAGDGGKPAAATHGGRRAEIAFQIFTPQQQREREAEKARRAQEQREAAERAAAEAAKAVSNKPEHSIPGEADLRKFVMLFRGGVTEEGVKAKIKSEGFDEVRTFAKVLENLDMVTGSDE